MIDWALWADINWMNVIALIWFVVCFRGYTWFAIRQARTTPCLANVLHLYRIDWMRRMMARENRIADTSAIANLERSVSFFASSTMLILAGLLTVLGASERAISVVSHLPFVVPATQQEWELKLLLLIGVFVYAFFKFTWSLRQYGFCSVLIGSAPAPAEKPGEAETNAVVARSAKMISMAANNFNFGLRSYYFGMAVLGWFISPWAFMLLSTGVVYVLYKREFRSSTLQELMVSTSADSVNGAYKID